MLLVSVPYLDTKKKFYFGWDSTFHETHAPPPRTFLESESPLCETMHVSGHKRIEKYKGYESRLCEKLAAQKGHKKQKKKTKKALTHSIHTVHLNTRHRTRVLLIRPRLPAVCRSTQ